MVKKGLCVGLGLTHLITMDLHQKEIQGFFTIPVDNLRASPFLLQYIQEEVQTQSCATVVEAITCSFGKCIIIQGISSYHIV